MPVRACQPDAEIVLGDRSMMKADLSFAETARMKLPSLHLRIAIPSWRLAEPTVSDGGHVVSRAEVQSMVDAAFAATGRGRARLTAREERDRDLAQQMRAALYPRH